MLDAINDPKAFDNFQALDNDADTGERDQLFRNMARLFTFVWDRCDDKQVEQYDAVLCQLAELVEVEGRSEVAQMLAPLERAPGTVVVKLANDSFKVAQPLLEFSSVLSDDDLIDIVGKASEEHRVAIAGRARVAERVGDAIVTHGGDKSVTRLVANENAELGHKTLSVLVEKAVQDTAVAENLRGRKDINWNDLHGKISSAGAEVLKKLFQTDKKLNPATMEQVNAVVFNRMRNKAGFNSSEWRVAWNQVKALADRRQLNQSSLARFSRFGYGHHFGAALCVMLRIKQEIFVKWLASQDYLAVSVAAKTLGLTPDVLERGIAILPWRDLPEAEEIKNIVARYEALDMEEAEGIFGLWREHAFRKKNSARRDKVAANG